MMERRLLIARQLLNPANSVLIVTIDEKEYLRLGLLLEQVFPEAQIEMITTVISAKGVARFGQFSRVEEFIFFARIGKSTVQLGEQNMLDESRSATAQIGKDIDWLGLRVGSPQQSVERDQISSTRSSWTRRPATSSPSVNRLLMMLTV